MSDSSAGAVRRIAYADPARINKRRTVSGLVLVGSIVVYEVPLPILQVAYDHPVTGGVVLSAAAVLGTDILLHGLVKFRTWIREHVVVVKVPKDPS